MDKKFSLGSDIMITEDKFYPVLNIIYFYPVLYIVYFLGMVATQVGEILNVL